MKYPISSNLTLPISTPNRLRLRLRWLWRSRFLGFVVLLYLGLSVTFCTMHIFQYTATRLVRSKSVIGETHGTSLLIEIEDSLRIDKMHSKISQLFTDNVRPYYIRAETTPNDQDVTATAFVTENCLSDLVRLAEMWKGPISATFHLVASTINETDPVVRKSLRILKNHFQKNVALRHRVDVHLIAGPIGNNPDGLPRPTNFHLNVARFFARSEFVLYLDHDTWPSPHTHAMVKKYKHFLIQEDVLVLPTFSFTQNLTVQTLPATKDELIQLVYEGSVGLQDDGWEINHGPTGLESWLKGQPYIVDEYELHYRPNFVSRKGGKIPWCSERFDDNKAACLYQMYLTGSELWVVPDAFLVRHNLNPDSHLIKLNQSKWTEATNSRLYSRFSQEACIHYGRQFVMAGKWNTEKAKHIKQECDRALTNLGKGLMD